MNNQSVLATPRTDAHAVGIIGFYSCATVTADFARQLERELNSANAEIARLKDEPHKCYLWVEERK